MASSQPLVFIFGRFGWRLLWGQSRAIGWLIVWRSISKTASHACGRFRVTRNASPVVSNSSSAGALSRYSVADLFRPFSCNCADRGRALCHAVVLLSGCEFCISRTVGGWHFDTRIFEHPLAGGLNPGNSRVHAFSRSNLCGADVCPADGVARSDGW